MVPVELGDRPVVEPGDGRAASPGGLVMGSQDGARPSSSTKSLRNVSRPSGSTPSWRLGGISKRLSWSAGGTSCSAWFILAASRAPRKADTDTALLAGPTRERRCPPPGSHWAPLPGAPLRSFLPGSPADGRRPPLGGRAWPLQPFAVLLPRVYRQGPASSPATRPAIAGTRPARSGPGTARKV